MEFYCHFTKFLLLRQRSWTQRQLESESELETNPNTLTACGDDDADVATDGTWFDEEEEGMETKLLHLKAN